MVKSRPSMGATGHETRFPAGGAIRIRLLWSEHKDTQPIRNISGHYCAEIALLTILGATSLGKRSKFGGILAPHLCDPADLIFSGINLTESRTKIAWKALEAARPPGTVSRSKQMDVIDCLRGITLPCDGRSVNAVESIKRHRIFCQNCTAVEEHSYVTHSDLNVTLYGKEKMRNPFDEILRKDEDFSKACPKCKDLGAQFTTSAVLSFGRIAIFHVPRNDAGILEINQGFEYYVRLVDPQLRAMADYRMVGLIEHTSSGNDSGHFIPYLAASDGFVRKDNGLPAEKVVNIKNLRIRLVIYERVETCAELLTVSLAEINDDDVADWKRVEECMIDFSPKLPAAFVGSTDQAQGRSKTATKRMKKRSSTIEPERYAPLSCNGGDPVAEPPNLALQASAPSKKTKRAVTNLKVQTNSQGQSDCKDSFDDPTIANTDTNHASDLVSILSSVNQQLPLSMVAHSDDVGVTLRELPNAEVNAKPCNTLGCWSLSKTSKRKLTSKQQVNDEAIMFGCARELVSFAEQFGITAFEKVRLIDCGMCDTLFAKRPLNSDTRAAIVKCLNTVDIFSSEYVILPTYRNAHWSLVICFLEHRGDQVPFLTITHLDSIPGYHAKICGMPIEALVVEAIECLWHDRSIRLSQGQPYPRGKHGTSLKLEESITSTEGLGQESVPYSLLKAEAPTQATGSNDCGPMVILNLRQLFAGIVRYAGEHLQDWIGDHFAKGYAPEPAILRTDLQNVNTPIDLEAIRRSMMDSLERPEAYDRQVAGNLAGSRVASELLAHKNLSTNNEPLPPLGPYRANQGVLDAPASDVGQLQLLPEDCDQDQSDNMVIDQSSNCSHDIDIDRSDDSSDTDASSKTESSDSESISDVIPNPRSTLQSTKNGKHKTSRMLRAQRVAIVGPDYSGDRVHCTNPNAQMEEHTILTLMPPTCSPSHFSSSEVFHMLLGCVDKFPTDSYFLLTQRLTQRVDWICYLQPKDMRKFAQYIIQTWFQRHGFDRKVSVCYNNSVKRRKPLTEYFMVEFGCSARGQRKSKQMGQANTRNRESRKLGCLARYRISEDKGFEILHGEHLCAPDHYKNRPGSVHGKPILESEETERLIAKAVEGIKANLGFAPMKKLLRSYICTHKRHAAAVNGAMPVDMEALEAKVATRWDNAEIHKIVREARIRMGYFNSDSTVHSKFVTLLEQLPVDHYQIKYHQDPSGTFLMSSVAWRHQSWPSTKSFRFFFMDGAAKLTAHTYVCIPIFGLSQSFSLQIVAVVMAISENSEYLMQALTVMRAADLSFDKRQTVWFSDESSGFATALRGNRNLTHITCCAHRTANFNMSFGKSAGVPGMVQSDLDRTFDEVVIGARATLGQLGFPDHWLAVADSGPNPDARFFACWTNRFPIPSEDIRINPLQWFMYLRNSPLEEVLALRLNDLRTKFPSRIHYVTYLWNTREMWCLCSRPVTADLGFATSNAVEGAIGAFRKVMGDASMKMDKFFGHFNDCASNFSCAARIRTEEFETKDALELLKHARPKFKTVFHDHLKEAGVTAAGKHFLLQEAASVDDATVIQMSTGRLPLASLHQITSHSFFGFHFLRLYHASRHELDRRFFSISMNLVEGNVVRQDKTFFLLVLASGSVICSCGYMFQYMGLCCRHFLAAWSLGFVKFHAHRMLDSFFIERPSIVKQDIGSRPEFAVKSIISSVSIDLANADRDPIEVGDAATWDSFTLLDVRRRAIASDLKLLFDSVSNLEFTKRQPAIEMHHEQVGRDEDVIPASSSPRDPVLIEDSSAPQSIELTLATALENLDQPVSNFGTQFLQSFFAHLKTLTGRTFRGAHSKTRALAVLATLNTEHNESLLCALRPLMSGTAILPPESTHPLVASKNVLELFFTAKASPRALRAFTDAICIRLTFPLIADSELTSVRVRDLVNFATSFNPDVLDDDFLKKTTASVTDALSIDSHSRNLVGNGLRNSASATHLLTVTSKSTSHPGHSKNSPLQRTFKGGQRRRAKKAKIGGEMS